MSDKRRKRSPYEQGELKSSPDRHVKRKKSKKSKRSHQYQLPPEAKPHIRTADDDDDVQIIEAGDHGEEEGGSLTIKPPQMQALKHKDRSHKHKKDKHRSHEHSSSRGRLGKADGHREREKDPTQNFRDAREIVRERKKNRELKEQEIQREIREREERKREESIKERERLERKELIRRRDSMREETMKVKVHEEKQKDVKRQLIDTRREFDKTRAEDYHSREDVHRIRSRDHDKSNEKIRHFPPPPRLQEDRASKKELTKSLSSSSLSKYGNRGFEEKHSEVDQDTRMVVVEDSGSDSKKTTVKEIEVTSKKIESSSELIEVDADDEDEEEDEEEDDSDDSDSDSDDTSSGESSSEEESSEEEEDDDREDAVENDADTSKEDGKEDDAVKVRSKFDDRSDIESPGKLSKGSNSDNYMPESPEMSDVEMKPEDSLPLYLPAIQGCRSVEEFNCLNRIEEGTYGVVYRALDKKTQEIVALKRLKMEKEKEGFPITSLREINTLLKAQHENIVTVREIVVGSNMDKIYIVMDFVEHDLKSLMENMKNPFLVGEVKTLLKQLLRAVRHLHDNWILHRDLKTSNLLLSHKGILKVGDFGLAREYGSPLKAYTPIVVTLWYRAPELLLGCKEYSTHIDMWSVGCIFAEFFLMKALWPGKSEIDQINKIFKDLGTPTEKIWPGVSELPGMKKVQFNENPYNVVKNRFGSYFTDLGFDLLNRFFAYDPAKRITAEEAFEHEYFRESPLPVDPSMFPTWPARSEQTRKHSNSPKPPSGGKAYQKLMDDEENFTAGGFHMSTAAKGASAQGMGFSLKF
uniref:cyclin-dependent kinase n=1 Tax=Arion vulgaris TaxID=1028688 RepID=A0A0B7B2D9_9EUPU